MGDPLLALMQQLAAQPVEELRKTYGDHPVVFHIIRVKILADPCRDYRVIMRRYHVSRGFVYKVWNES